MTRRPAYSGGEAAATRAPLSGETECVVARGVSASVLSSSLSQVKRARGAHEMSFQEYFQERWIMFLKANFASEAQIAAAFNVTSVTARNWLTGVSSPRGHCVARAFQCWPAEAARLIDRDRRAA